ncbi:MAG TPA: HemK/PrmC family methyltransferase [Planctomycetota bacterium]
MQHGALERLLVAGARALSRAGVAPARPEAERLWEGASGVSRLRQHAGLAPPPEPSVVRRFRARVRRRALGTPLAYVEGWTEFHGRRFAVDERVLIPRADSECLVDAALGMLPAAARGLVIDLGTGSGCLLLSILAARPGLRGLGIDRSDGALRVARANARALGISGRCDWLRGDWLASLRGAAAALVVANPPYVAPGESLGPGVAEHEPALALFTPAAAPLAAYWAILARLSGNLAGAGGLIFEVGAGRAQQVAELCGGAGLAVEAVKDDLCGIARAVCARPLRSGSTPCA